MDQESLPQIHIKLPGAQWPLPFALNLSSTQSFLSQEALTSAGLKPSLIIAWRTVPDRGRRFESYARRIDCEIAIGNHFWSISMLANFVKDYVHSPFAAYSEYGIIGSTFFSAIEDHTAGDIIDALGPVYQPVLFGPNGELLVKHGNSENKLIIEVAEINAELLQHLHADPAMIYNLSPRQFEELMAKLLEQQGYTVTLTPASGDGGVDIFAAHKSSLGSFLYVVECKKYAPDRPVGVGIIRSLYGVVQARRATAGIVATTSFFTKGARRFQHDVQYQLTLRDFNDVQHWVANALPDTENR
jgi:hypothetical protein